MNSCPIVRNRRAMLAATDHRALAKTMSVFVSTVMLFAPVSMGAAIACTVGHAGLGVLASSVL
jgi:hypothetical protein